MNLEAEISLKRAIILIAVVVLVFIGGFYAIGKLLFWDQYSKNTLDDIKVTEAKKVINQNPKDIRGYIALATVYYEEGKYDEALREAKIAQKIKKNVAIDHIMGLAYFQLKQYDQAINSLNKVIKNNPIHFEALVNLGYAYEGKKDYRKALNYYDQALSVEPGSADVLVSEALVYEKMGNKKDGLKLINKALKYVPDYKEWLDIKTRLSK